MHRRGFDRIIKPDYFDNILLPENLQGFKFSIHSLIEGYINTSTRTDLNAIPKLRFFLQWLEMEPKPEFERKDWLSTDEAFFFTVLFERHYTVMTYDPGTGI